MTEDVQTASAAKIAASPKPHVGPDDYPKMYEASVNDPDAFWGEHGKRIDWIKPYTKVKNTSFTPGNIDIRWFEDGTLNVSANCIDRHLETRGDQTAIIWEPDNPADPALHITYRDLHASVCKMANVLKGLGIEKGDRVIIYLPMIPEAAYAMLACARIGAIHSIVFAGFSPDALGARINGCDAKLVITADYAPRGGRETPLKSNTDTALLHCKDSVNCLVVKRTGGQTTWTDRDHDCNALMAEAAPECPVQEMQAEDPLFILYTSGSTGQPKGVVHCTGGYLVYASMTHEIVFDYHEGDVFWCTADVGWVTGHSYIVYGPLANGATTLMFEGVPTYPRCRPVLAGLRQAQGQPVLHRADRHSRADGRKGNEWVEKHDLSDLRILGHGRRADQPRSLELVQRRGRQGQMPDRRHLVADRDRRPHDDPAAGGVEAEAGRGDASRSLACSRWFWTPHRAKRSSTEWCRGRAVHQGQLAGSDAHGLGRPRAVRKDLFQRLQGLLLLRRRLPPRRGRRLLDHRPRR